MSLGVGGYPHGESRGVVVGRHGDPPAVCLDDFRDDIQAEPQPLLLGGHERLEQLRRAAPELKVIVVTGYSSEIVHGETTPEPGTYFLSKPYEFATLATTLRTALAS